jgi:hypothetical protein
MPFIHTKSLPLENRNSVPDVINNISKSFQEDTEIEEKHITVTWEYYESNHYSFGGLLGKMHDFKIHQIIVDLLIPNFNDKNMIKKMMTSISNNLSEGMGCPCDRIFIHCRFAHPS